MSKQDRAKTKLTEYVGLHGIAKKWGLKIPPASPLFPHSSSPLAADEDRSGSPAVMDDPDEASPAVMDDHGEQTLMDDDQDEASPAIIDDRDEQTLMDDVDTGALGKEQSDLSELVAKLRLYDPTGSSALSSAPVPTTTAYKADFLLLGELNFATKVASRTEGNVTMQITVGRSFEGFVLHFSNDGRRAYSTKPRSVVIERVETEDQGPEAVIVTFRDLWTDTRRALILQASSPIITCTMSPDDLRSVWCPQQVVNFCINAWVRFLYERGPCRTADRNVWVAPLEYAAWILGRKPWNQDGLGAQYRLRREDFVAARSSFTTMVIPVLDADRRHYWVASVEMKDMSMSVQIYDSLGPSNSHATFFRQLQHKEGMGEGTLTVMDTLRQRDSISCGIFTMLFIAHAAGIDDSYGNLKVMADQIVHRAAGDFDVSQARQTLGELLMPYIV